MIDLQHILSKVGIEVSFEISEVDGIPVLFIDTPELREDLHGPRLRVYLNDEPIYTNPDYPGEDYE